MAAAPRVSIVSLGCARNDVDSEELAGRLAADGWLLSEAGDSTDVVLVNTCGFIEQAKKDSIDTLLEAVDAKASGNAVKVVAVGCMAQRYGKELADELTEADAVLGFDHYDSIGQSLRAILRGESIASHEPSDRRDILPIAPVERVPDGVPGMGPHVFRQRLDGRPWAPLKIASGCDRKCAFCAIPQFRGSFVSRHPDDVVAEALWLAEHGVREVLLVSENSTSYGKDLGDVRLLEHLLPRLAAIEGLDWVRVSYLQPAETRPELVRVITQTPGVAPYLDMSFQHASGGLLRTMRRFGDAESFLQLIEDARSLNPTVGIRSNVIVGFPGESEDDVSTLIDFLQSARLDAVGVFGYSDEDGTEARELPGHLPQAEVDQRVALVAATADRSSNAAAEERVGSRTQVLLDNEGNLGRAIHQGPETDGQCVVLADRELAVGEMVTVDIIATDGVDLVSEIVT